MLFEEEEGDKHYPSSFLAKFLRTSVSFKRCGDFLFSLRVRDKNLFLTICSVLRPSKTLQTKHHFFPIAKTYSINFLSSSLVH